jgi:hypothetical protein
VKGIHPGHFEELGEVSFIGRLDDENTRVRMVWQPEEPVRRDLRLFALLAAPAVDLLPTGEWSWVDCSLDRCARLAIDGVESAVLGFTDDGSSYSLVSNTEP